MTSTIHEMHSDPEPGSGSGSSFDGPGSAPAGPGSDADTVEGAARRGRPARVRTVVAAAALVIAGGAGAALWSSSSSGSSGTAAASSTVTTSTATVSRRDLVEQATVDGTLGYGDTTALFGPMGTVTGIVPVGTVVERGGSVAQVDGRPVPLLYGTVPLWRPLSAASSDGEDVRMLEENLQALGFTAGLSFTVDDHWDAATLVAVERWQKALGRDQTGAVAVGDAVVHDGPARIAKVDAVVGQVAPGGSGLVEVTGTTQLVQASVKASQQSLLHEGDAVDVVLPGGATVTGRITKVGTVATTASGEDGGGSSDATVAVDVTLDDVTAAGSLDQAPVSVMITSNAAQGVLAVPVDALLALREGGYAVEVRRGDATELVAVTPGMFASGWVEVEGDLSEGDDVVVPK